MDDVPRLLLLCTRADAAARRAAGRTARLPLPPPLPHASQSVASPEVVYPAATTPSAATYAAEPVAAPAGIAASRPTRSPAAAHATRDVL